MNGFTAADMSTAAANGFRDGLAAQPAAAQEAVAWQVGDEFYTSESLAIEEIQQWGPSGAIAIPLYAAPVAAAPVDAPSIESAHAMGAKGAPANDAERLAFEAWMRGHCWALCATWDGAGYRSDAEQGGGYCPNAARTRMLWAAWRDRAALASNPAAPGIDLEQFREAVLAQHAALMDSWCGDTETKEAADKQRDQLLTLIDASPKEHAFLQTVKGLEFDAPMDAVVHESPKGGCTDAKDAARWRVAREQNGVTISVEEADDDGDMQFVSGHTPEEIDAAMDAMLATSAGVGS